MACAALLSAVLPVASAMGQAGTTSKRKTKPAAKAPVAVAAPVAPLPAALASGVPLAVHDAPDGRTIATVSSAVPVVPLARDKGWVRVRVEGWAKDDGQLVPADASTRVLSAADLRADPQGARGKTVRWDVEVLALQTADPLHRDLSPNEPYLLARGPGKENTILYVAVPPGLLSEAKALQGAAPVMVSLVATVRNGRSEPVGVPILDAQSVVKKGD
jgi:hypothetical protein